MPVIINFQPHRTKRALEKQAVEKLSPEDISDFEFMADLVRKYRPDLTQGKSRDRMILDMQEFERIALKTIRSEE